MQTPLTDSVTERSAASDWTQMDWHRLAGIVMTVYVVCLPVALLSAPIGLVVVFEQPIVAALKFALLGVVPGYLPVVFLAVGESRPLAPESED